MRSLRRALLLTALCTLLITSLMLGVGSAGPPGKWTQVGTNSANYGQPGLERTEDGVLHAFWVRNAANGQDDEAVHTPIAADGTVGATTGVTGNIGLIDPVVDLISDGAGGLRSYYGISDINLGFGVHTRTADSTGTTWSAPTKLGTGGGSSAATLGPNNVPYLVHDPGGQGIIVHVGTNPSGPESSDYAAAIPGCCAYSPNIATEETSNTVWIVWYSSANDPQDASKCYCGVYAQQVNLTTGDPVGTPTRMPGSATVFNGAETSSQMTGRVPMVARVGGNIYVAYPTGYPTTDKLRLWRIGSTGPASTSQVIATSGQAGLDAVALAADPDGGIWVLWHQDGSVRGVESDPDVTFFSPPVKFADPAAATLADPYSLVADSQNRKVDVIGNYPAGNGTVYFHTQLLAPLMGTDGNDTLNGTAAKNVMAGGAGSDTLRGRGNNDILDGGAGRDTLIGGPGRDTCYVTKGDVKKSCEVVKKRRAHG